MFTRMTTWKGKASETASIKSNVEAKRADIAAVPGLLACHVVWNDDGSGVTFAIYESEDAANTASAQIQAIWADLATLFTAPPETVTYTQALHLK